MVRLQSRDVTHMQLAQQFEPCWWQLLMEVCNFLNCAALIHPEASDMLCTDATVVGAVARLAVWRHAEQRSEQHEARLPAAATLLLAQLLRRAAADVGPPFRAPVTHNTHRPPCSVSVAAQRQRALIGHLRGRLRLSDLMVGVRSSSALRCAAALHLTACA